VGEIFTALNRVSLWLQGSTAVFKESLTLKKASYLCAPSMAKEPLAWEAVSGSAPDTIWLCLPSVINGSYICGITYVVIQVYIRKKVTFITPCGPSIVPY